MVHNRRPVAEAPEIILYHADCADGFGAAWAIWKRYPSARFVPVKHGAPPPPGLTGRRLVIVDFSYPRPILEALAAESAGILVLDHHITAQEALQDLPYARFEQKKSGAVMAWEWAHGTPPPWLLAYIQDKDLWNWALPRSREINAALASYPFDFEVWDRFRRDRLETEGEAILRYEGQLLDKIVAEALLVTFHGATVPAVHSSILTSQLGERLSRGVPFCIIWHDRDGRRYFSLRSAADGADVGAIASAYGGGGHAHAAGFSLPLDDGDLAPIRPVPPRLALPPSGPSDRGRSA